MTLSTSAPARVAAEAAAAETAAREGLAALAAAAATPPAPSDPPTPAPAPAEPPTPAPAPPVQPVQPVADINDVLKRQQTQLDALMGRQQQLVDQNAALVRELAAARATPPAPAPAPAPAPVLVTAEDRKEYGDDLISLIERASRQAFGSTLSDLSSRLAALEGRLGNAVQRVEQVQATVQTTAFDRYLSYLDKEIPGWRAVNDAPEFLAWLAEKDTLSGKARHDLLADAHEALDGERVAGIFATYKPELRAAPAGPAPAAQPPQQPTPHIDPATLAAPPTAPAAPPPQSPPTGRLWKQSEVDKLYEDKQKGRITAQQFEAEEREYMKALAEGRVIVDQ